MDEIKVSVLCFTFNQKKYVSTCLDSIVSQKVNFNYEILIHDDASIDGTIDVLKEYEKKYSNIRVIYEKENIYSQNKKVDKPLFQYIKGKYIAYCEGDDYWETSDKLQKQYDALENNRSCSISLHKVQKINREGEKLNKFFEQTLFTPGVIDGRKYLTKYLEGSGSLLLQTSSIFVKSEYLVNRPEELEKFKVGDVPLLLWATYNGDVYYIDDIMSCYRVQSESSTNVLMKKNSYALERSKTNAEGFLAFDKLTNHELWDVMKHRVCYYIAQSYYGSKKEYFSDIIGDSIKEITVIERIKAKIKYTKIGNIMRK